MRKQTWEPRERDCTFSTQFYAVLSKTKPFFPKCHFCFHKQASPFQMSGMHFKYFTGCEGKLPWACSIHSAWECEYLTLNRKQDVLGWPMARARLVRKKCFVSWEMLWTGNLNKCFLVQILAFCSPIEQWGMRLDTEDASFVCWRSVKCSPARWYSKNCIWSDCEAKTIATVSRMSLLTIPFGWTWLLSLRKM